MFFLLLDSGATRLAESSGDMMKVFSAGRCESVVCTVISIHFCTIWTFEYKFFSRIFTFPVEYIQLYAILTDFYV